MLDTDVELLDITAAAGVCSTAGQLEPAGCSPAARPAPALLSEVTLATVPRTLVSGVRLATA